MTDGVRSLIGMCAGGFCAVIAPVLYFDWLGVIIYPYVLLWWVLLIFFCTLIGGLAGYCLGAEDGEADKNEQGG